MEAVEAAVTMAATAAMEIATRMVEKIMYSKTIGVGRG